MTIAIIGGSGIYDPVWMSEAGLKSVSTPYGTVEVQVGLVKDSAVRTLFINRHGNGHSIPPHRVNYRANVWALRELGADRIIATAAVGSLNRTMPPGALVLPDQFLDFTKSRPATFFDGEDGGANLGVVHTDMTTPFCPELTRGLEWAAEHLAMSPLLGPATYVCTEGPRFETPAEIRAYQVLGGDLVGMTAVPEVVLARELGLCYQTIGLVTNWAAGLSGQPLSHQEVLDLMGSNRENTMRLLGAALNASPEQRSCSCGGVPGPLSPA